MKPEISLVMPAYNEELRIGDSIEKVVQYFIARNISFEFIVVDDGSTDRTREIVSAHTGIILLTLEQNSGKGAAVKRGMLEASGKYVYFCDADLSTPISEIEKLQAELTSGSDICIGSRAIDNKMIKKHQPFYREWMGKTFNKIVRVFAVRGIKDTQCGFKGFRSEAAKEVFSRTQISGFGFDVEALYIANKIGYNIKEIPVLWFNDERSKVDPIKDSIRMLIDIFKIRILHKGRQSKSSSEIPH